MESKGESKEYIRRDFLSRFNIRNARNVRIKALINQQYLDELGDETIQIVESGMGTGKTKVLINKLTGMKEKSMVSLTCRCSLTREQSARYRRHGLDFKDYLNFRPEDLHDKVIISAESLRRLQRRYSIVIIDEVTSFLNQLFSGLKDKFYKKNMETLYSLIRDADMIICMDTPIDMRVMDLFAQLRPNDMVHLTCNSFQPLKGYSWCMLGIHTMLGYLYHYLAQGKKVIVVAGSENFARRYILPLVTSVISSDKVRYYSSRSENYLDELEDVRAAWIQFQAVIYTATIGPGIDFDIPHFDIRFVFGNSRTLIPRESHQMRGRARHLVDRIEFVHLKTIKHNQSFEYEDILYNIQHQIKFGVDGYDKAVNMLERETSFG